MPAPVPDGPRDGMLGLRTMARMKADVLGVYADLQRNYGDVVSFRTGPFCLFIFYHPDQVRELLAGKAKSFIRFPRVMKTFAQWNGDSTLIVEGEQWIRQRRLVQPAFQPRRMVQYGDSIVSCTRKMLDGWRQQMNGDGQLEVDMDGAMTTLTLQIICKTMFDTNMEDEASGQLAQAVATLSQVAFHEIQANIRYPLWLPTSYNRRKRQAMKTLDDAVWRIVRERRAEGRDHGDLLSMLLTAVDDEAGQLTDEQVRNEVTTLVLAGHDTTASALNWVCWNLARYPDVAKRCRDEIDAVLQGRAPGAADVPQLTYVEAMIKETLRLYPPAISVFLRQATADVTIGDVAIPKGALISVSTFVTQRDGRWFEDPQQFDPERFLPPRLEAIRPGAYFPFGAGPRVCIGQTFAMTEMTLVVALLLQSFFVDVTRGDEHPGMDVKMALRPKRRVLLRWSDRKFAKDRSNVPTEG